MKLSRFHLDLLSKREEQILRKRIWATDEKMTFQQLGQFWGVRLGGRRSNEAKKIITEPYRKKIPGYGHKVLHLDCDNGRTYTVYTLAALLGVTAQCIFQRIRDYGWDSPLILTNTPVKGFSLSGEAVCRKPTNAKVMGKNGNTSDNHQLAAKGLDHFFDGVEARLAAFGERFVQAGAGDTGLSGDFSHALCPGRRVKGVDKLLWGAFSGILKKKMDVLFRLKVLGRVEGACFQCHVLFLHVLQQTDCFFNIPGLGGFIATGQQEDYFSPIYGVIHPVAWTEKHAKLEQVVADGLAIAKSADHQLVDPPDNPCMGFAVFDLRQPLVKMRRASQLVSHIFIASMWIQKIKGRLKKTADFFSRFRVSIHAPAWGRLGFGDCKAEVVVLTGELNIIRYENMSKSINTIYTHIIWHEITDQADKKPKEESVVLVYDKELDDVVKGGCRVSSTVGEYWWDMGTGDLLKDPKFWAKMPSPNSFDSRPGLAIE